MRILLSPVRNDTSRIYYEFEKDVIKVAYEDKEDTFDFREVPDGELMIFDVETGERLITTDLGIQPLISAERIEGALYVELLNYIGINATHEERFPEWIDHEDYVAPEPLPEPDEELRDEELRDEEPNDDDNMEGWDEF